jgi:hypothetical protein
MRLLHLVLSPTATETLCQRRVGGLGKDEPWSSLSNYDGLVADDLLTGYEVCAACLIEREKSHPPTETPS